MVKYMTGSRIPVFGHAAHSVFQFSSVTYVDVPDTFSATTYLTNNAVYLEAMFAGDHDKVMQMRCWDPANPSLPPQWEVTLTAGHAFQNWWTFETVKIEKSHSSDPWQRQCLLQVRSVNGSPMRLGSAVLWIH